MHPLPTQRRRSTESLDARQNLLLAALTAREWQRWLPQLEYVDMPAGLVISECGVAMSHAYFPATAMVALLYGTETGDSAETAIIGNEGMIGTSLFMGGDSTLSRGVVQSSGHGFRMKASAIKEEIQQPLILQLLLRYAQAVIAQTLQTAACNRHHSLEQQLCRLLLMTLDRTQGAELVMTHERLSIMLGVRREGVTENALKLQDAGLIRYARGHITALDRPGLEHRACECYAVVQKEYGRLLPELTAVRSPFRRDSTQVSRFASPAIPVSRILL